MKLTNLLILSSIVLASLMFSCAGDDDADPCSTTLCPVGFTAVAVGTVCECVDDGTTSPCEGVICEGGTIPVVVGGNCECQTDPNTINIVDVTGFTGTETWTRDNVYILNGKVVVGEGEVLTIQAGTIIKGSEGTGSLASAMIVARGGQIQALGTAAEPIIFTSVQDNITPGSIMSPNLSEFDNALWGGLIVLGNAPISAGSGDTEAQIEGIPADDTFGRYGGTDVADNSGTIQYVSVRHGGALIGDDNEINGITFGGVGNGTTVDNIEVVANLDDGVEWFGGTVNCTNVIVAMGEDDGIDIDQNYAGTISNAVVIQSGATSGDNALEIDGPEGSTFTDGQFTIVGVTLIDEDGGADTAADLKSNTQGTITNASWRGYGDNVKIRFSCEASDCSTARGDSYLNFINGDAQILDSEWVGTASLADWTTVYGDEDCANETPCMVTQAEQSAITDLLSAGGNMISSDATRGADLTPFADWTWSSLNGKLN